MSIVAPITQGAALAGFVVLGRPPPPFELTYEDRDLLMTMGDMWRRTLPSKRRTASSPRIANSRPTAG